ncbi:MAG: hypothetical protein DRJ10_06620 [Bacteroidetes bacterium]|nr:MAG: hypothetical protein DRJ10_06620 [Bacteroidota bacterium]
MSLLSTYKKQQFQTNIFSLLINPLFLLRKILFKRIKILAPELSGKLLDFGCGSKPYKSRFLNVSEYIGLDIENNSHDHNKEEIDVFYDGKKIPFPDNHFDSVFSSEVLEHIFEPDLILKEINRILKPGGKALFTLPFAWNEHEVPNDYARYTSFGIKYLFEKHGFKVIKQIKAGHMSVVIAQLRSLYVYEFLASKNKYFNILISLVFIFPLNLAGFIFSSIMPKNYSLFFNNIILVQK